MKTVLSTLLVATILSATAVADEPASLEVDRAWARLQPPSSRMTGAYMEIRNPTAEPDALLGASCDGAERVELHVMEETNGTMTMRHVERLEVPAGSSLRLAPGGAHLMIMGLAERLEVEQVLRIELAFERAGKLAVPVPVRDARRDVPR